MKKNISNKTINEIVNISIGGYCSHKKEKISIEYWLYCLNEVKNNSNVRKIYKQKFNSVSGEENDI